MRKNAPFTLEDVHEPTKEEIAEKVRAAAGVEEQVEMETAARRGEFQNPSGFGRPGKYPWGAMKVGDSVKVLPEHLNERGEPTQKFRSNICVQNSKNRPKRWVTGRTKDEPKHWRLWRTA